MSHPTEATRFGVKVYIDETDQKGDQSTDLEPFIHSFHRWIQEDRLVEAGPLDVADYRHVHNGPQVILVCQAGHYALDRSDGELGLLYNEKRGPDGTFREWLEAAVAAVLNAVSLFEEEASPEVRFRDNRLLIRIQDRLRAPNRSEVYIALRPELEAVLARLFPGADLELEHLGADPRAGFTVRVDGSKPFLTRGLMFQI